MRFKKLTEMPIDRLTSDAIFEENKKDVIKKFVAISVLKIQCMKNVIKLQFIPPKNSPEKKTLLLDTFSFFVNRNSGLPWSTELYHDRKADDWTDRFQLRGWSTFFIDTDKRFRSSSTVFLYLQRSQVCVVEREFDFLYGIDFFEELTNSKKSYHYKSVS